MKPTLALAVAATCLACAAHADAPQGVAQVSRDRLSFGGGRAAFVTVVSDRETGCEYLAYEGDVNGGSMVPRMKPDGKQLCRPQ